MNKTLPPSSHAAPHGGCCGHDHGHAHHGGHAAASPPHAAGAALLRIPAMDCAAEEADIRRALEPIPGIRGLSFQLGARTLGITAPPAVMPQVLETLRHAGFEAQVLAPGQGAGGKPSSVAGLWRLGLALALACAAELIHFLAPAGQASEWLGLGLAATAIALSGLDTYRKGLSALRHGRLNINALMTVAVTGAFLIGQWPEAAMVMALYAIAELIEARSVDRARNAIKALLDLAPREAQVQQPDHGWRTVPVEQITLGSRLRIRPGERLPLDGIVASGRSAINQAPVTGESLPVDKTVGDTVFAGTVNGTGELIVRVTALAADTTLARIIHAVEQAQSTRAPTQRFVDRFAAVYTPAVFAIALAVALLAPWLMGWDWTQALYKALVLLVIACPCALVISTPVTVVSALAAAARRGILIKGGTYLEQARLLRAIALDKTGTLTQGQPRLVEQAVLAEPAQAGGADLRHLAASLAGRSDHPVSRAIAQGLPAGEPVALDDVQALPGRGLRARHGGRAYVLGNHRLIEERGQDSPALRARLLAHEAAGHTVTLLADDSGVLALFTVADTVRATSREAVTAMQALGLHPVMLSGDNTATAQTIASQVGIGDARGQLLPHDKLQAIDELRQHHGLVAMTGDGINDAPALARADIGIAMGGAGTDTAMEAADVVIMNDDLRRIPELIRLSRHTHAILWQNIALALGIKAVFLGLAVFGEASMWMAVFADMGASLLVVANGLRPIYSRPCAD